MHSYEVLCQCNYLLICQMAKILEGNPDHNFFKIFSLAMFSRCVNDLSFSGLDLLVAMTKGVSDI